MIKIYNIAGRLLPNYILTIPKGLIVVDTGFSGGADKFFRRLEKYAEPKEIKYLFLTHSHDDHVGYAKEIIDLTPARLVVHKLAVPILKTGQSLKPKDAGYTSKRAAFLGRIQHKLNRPRSGFPPLNVRLSDIIISDESD